MLGYYCSLEGYCCFILTGGAAKGDEYLSKNARALDYRRAMLSFASECLCYSKAAKIAISGFSVVSSPLELERDFSEEASDAINDCHYYYLTEVWSPRSFKNLEF